MEHTLFPSRLPTGDRDIATTERDPEKVLARGECPWCGSEYENVSAHASQAHPEEWANYKEETKE